MSFLPWSMLVNPTPYSGYPVGRQTVVDAEITSGTVTATFDAAGDGDFIVCALVVGSSSAATGTLDTNGGQWAEQATQSATVATYDATLSLVTGFATSVSKSISWSLSGSSLALIGGRCYRFVDRTTPLDVAVQTAAHNSTCFPNPPAITPVTANAIVFGFGALVHNDGSKTGSSPDLSNQDARAVTSGTPDGRIIIGDFEWTAGTFDPAIFSISSEATNGSAVSGVVAIRPAT